MLTCSQQNKDMGKHLETWSDIVKAEKRTKSRIALVVGSVLLIIGLGLFGTRALDRLTAHEARENWVRVPCQIESVEVDEEFHFFVRKGGNHSRRGHHSPEGNIIIRYTYTYGGTDYEGDRYCVPTQSSLLEKCRQRASAIESKQEHYCYVNPAEPDESAYTIVPAGQEDWRVWLLPAALCICGLIFLRELFRRNDSDD